MNNLQKFHWLKKNLQEKLPWLAKAVVDEDRYTIDEFLDSWIYHLAEHHFIQIFGDCQGYMIFRPARLGWVFDADTDYFESLWCFDLAGEVVWIDSLWAPGNYAQVLKTLKWTAKPYVAWSHKDKLYFKVIRELSGQVPSRREIAEAAVRELVSH